MSNKGKIIQVMGPVVDVAFEDENLPAIRDALEVNNGDKKCVMKLHSISVTIQSAVLCLLPVKVFAEIWK